jgi:DNA-binding transcriptional LysR family regulator
MELRRLHAFVCVVRFRSFSDAGRALYVDQSTVSRRVRQLEDELGLVLLDRGAAPIGLTPQGKVFLPRAQAVLAAVRDAEHAAEVLRKPPRTG